MLSIGFLAVPLTQVQEQANYKPVSQLKSQSFQVIGFGYSDYLSLYSLDYIAPEVIYNYGDKIPSIRTSEGYIIPNERQFCLLTNKANPETIESLSNLYKIEFLETYDLNFSAKASRGYKTRLVNKLYKLTRK